MKLYSQSTDNAQIWSFQCPSYAACHMKGTEDFNFEHCQRVWCKRTYTKEQICDLDTMQAKKDQHEVVITGHKIW